MSGYEKAIVASGHHLVSEAAAEILKEGGNAFDAIVGAGFVSTIVEPALTSLGGGGFLLSHQAASSEQIFFDFFVDTPGKGFGQAIHEPHFFPVTVDFLDSSQDFNVGLGSVAVPGTLKGLLHVHSRLGRMDLADVLSPAIAHARGHLLNKQQAHFLTLLKPIMTLTDAGKNLYLSKSGYIKEGDNLINHDAADFIASLVYDGADDFYHGDIARQIGDDMQNGDGLLTYDDLNTFTVLEKKPLDLPLKKYRLLTAPAPSMGGALIALSLSLLERKNPESLQYGSKEYLQSLTELMATVEMLRDKGVTDGERVKAFLVGHEEAGNRCSQSRLFSRGTTHISISDKEGNCAAMTCSNGEGSGYFAPGTGVMLNNMMGEDDLHPDGFHSSPPGDRVFSMMSPSLLLDEKAVKLVIGSGGSKRIRTAISQVVSQVIHYNRDLQQAVDAPRLYLDGTILHVEPGFDAGNFSNIPQIYTINEWRERDVYFGGVHAVIPGLAGAGDPRRGGAVKEVVSSS